MSEALLSLVVRAADAVEPLIDKVTETGYGRATPCPDFDLKQLTQHLIGGLSGFADLAEGKPLTFGSDPDLPADASSAFRAAADRVITGFGEPDAIGRSFAVPWGQATGAQLLGFELVELLVHGWDIARSLGTTPTFDDGLVAATLAGTRAWGDDSIRVPHLFGPEVAVDRDAPVLDQLVGFLGRDPAWGRDEGGRPDEPARRPARQRQPVATSVVGGVGPTLTRRG